METYSIFDVIFFVALILSAIFGYIKGFVRQLIGLVGIIAGTYFAYKLASVSSNLWHGHFDEKVVRIIIFTILAIIIYVLALWLAKIIGKLLKMAMLNWLNRLSGMLFSVIKILILFCIISYSIHFLKLQNMESLKADLNKSQTYNHLVYMATMIFPYIK